MKYVLAFFITVGYISNMYFLTVDDSVRKYQWINKTGVIIIPLGSVMGYVYIADKNISIKENNVKK